MILLLITLYFVIGLIVAFYEAMKENTIWFKMYVFVGLVFPYLFAWPYYLWKRYV